MIYCLFLLLLPYIQCHQIYSYEHFVEVSNSYVEQARRDYGISPKIIHHKESDGKIAGDAHDFTKIINLYHYSHVTEPYLKFTIYHEFGHIYHGHPSKAMNEAYFILVKLMMVATIFSLYTKNEIPFSIGLLLWIIHALIYHGHNIPQQEYDANQIACDKLLKNKDYNTIIYVVHSLLNKNLNPPLQQHYPTNQDEYDNLVPYLRERHNLTFDVDRWECYFGNQYVGLIGYSHGIYVGHRNGYVNC